MIDVTPEDAEKRSEMLANRLQSIRAARKRKKWRLRSSLLKYTDDIVTMLEFEDYSYAEVSAYLKRYHRLSVSRQRVHTFYKSLIAAVPESNHDDDFWGDAGALDAPTQP